MGWCVAQLEGGRSALALKGIAGLVNEAVVSEFFDPVVDDHPLLPGYTFANFDARDGEAVHRMRHLRGVAALLPVGHEWPTEIDAVVIDRLKSDLNDGNYDDAGALPAHRFKKGEMIKIVSGPYSVFGFARFLQVDHGMVVAEVTLLGCTAKVRLKGHQIEQA